MRIIEHAPQSAADNSHWHPWFDEMVRHRAIGSHQLLVKLSLISSNE